MERKAVYKTPAMGWTYNNDSQSKRTVYFKEMEDAVFYCREMGRNIIFTILIFSFSILLGFGYEVQYPHFRYYQKKSYADNFKWKGNPKNEEDF